MITTGNAPVPTIIPGYLKLTAKGGYPFYVNSPNITAFNRAPGSDYTYIVLVGSEFAWAVRETPEEIFAMMRQSLEVWKAVVDE